MFRMGQSSLTCCGSSHSASTPLSLLALTRRTLSRTSPRVWARFITPRWLNRKSYSSSSGQDLPQLQRVLVDRRALVPEVVGADDGGVPGHVAAGQPALFQDGDVGHPVVLGQVVGGGQTVSAAAHDHGVVGGLGSGLRQRKSGCSGRCSVVIVLLQSVLPQAGCRRAGAEMRVEREPVGEGADASAQFSGGFVAEFVVEAGDMRAEAMMSATSRELRRRRSRGWPGPGCRSAARRRPSAGGGRTGRRCG